MTETTMLTRSLETQSIYRVSVQNAEVMELGSHHVLLKSSAIITTRTAVSSADVAMLNQCKLAGVGEKVEGRIRIDLINDRILRVRYAEGQTVPDNQTPMLETSLGQPPSSARETPPPSISHHHAAADSQTAPGECITIKTPAYHATLTLTPWRIDIRSPQGKPITGIGGPEKDGFCQWDAINMGICRTSDQGSPVATECFDLLHDEAIFGLGEKFIKLDKVAQTIDLNMMDALGVSTPRSYKNVPFYISTRGYGVFFNHSSLMTYWLGSRSACDIQVAAQDDFLDYFILIGDIRQVLGLYTDLTGKGQMPPTWTFGYWQSKISYTSAVETLEIARKLREHQVPCDVIHLDTFWFERDWYCDLQFAKDRFPDPAGYLRELAKMGFKVSLWQLPYIPEGSALFDDLKRVNGFVKDAAGAIYNCGICFTPGFKGTVGVIDFTNPAAVNIYKEHLARLFRLGAKVIKSDFGEAAPLNGIYHDGTPGSRMHNLYPLLYNKAVFEVTRQETGEGVVWARSACAGGQRYPLHWGGDNSPNLFNLAPQIDGGLSLGLSGFQFWSQDIGGFLGKTNDELLIRWTQVGMFTSHSRIHGSGDRELYKFKPRTLQICRDYIQLRYRLLPYILSQAQKCVLQSLPMMRALVVDYPDDPTTYNISDQYLFGDDILVAPIMTEHPARKIYLPAGTWTCWWTGTRITGPRWIDVEADIETLPLYIREGAVIPLGPTMNYVDEKPIDELEVRLGLLEAPGSSEILLRINDHSTTLRYTRTGDQHCLEVKGTAVPVRLWDKLASPVQLIQQS